MGTDENAKASESTEWNEVIAQIGDLRASAEKLESKALETRNKLVGSPDQKAEAKEYKGGDCVIEHIRYFLAEITDYVLETHQHIFAISNGRNKRS